MLDSFRRAKQAEIDALQTLAAENKLPAPYTGPRPSFRKAIAGKPPAAVIAEYKRASPSKGDINLRLGPGDVARAYAQGGASALSILTEEAHFKGRLEYMETAAETGLPILRKDFLLHPLQVAQTAATKASALLLIVRMFEGATDLGHMIHETERAGLDAVVEIFHESELETARQAGASIIQVNNRDLDSLAVDPQASVRMIEAKRPEEIWVAASGVETGARIAEYGALGYDAVLIGSFLMQGDDPASKLAALLAEAGQ